MLKSNFGKLEVLNLVKSGIPSIHKILMMYVYNNLCVLNLIITGMPSILKTWVQECIVQSVF